MGSQTFTSSGTWTVPSGVNTATLEAWSAGGGGASWPVNGGGSPGGGGGGAYSIAVISIVPGQVYTVDVGTGGAAGSGDGGSNGGDSAVSLSGVDKVRATGGRGAYRTAIGPGGTGTFTGGDGGTGNPFVTKGGGGGGGGAATASGPGTSGQPGSNLSLPPAAGGSFGGGNGGTVSNGTDGLAPGGGGGGGSLNGPSGNAGGSGANGQVIITWTVTGTTKTITGKSRITVNTTKTITGKSRITNIPQSGYNVIRMATAPASGKSLQVTYYRLGQDLIICQDDALIAARALVEGSTGKYQQLAQDTSNTNPVNGLQATQQALSTYSTLPITITLRTYRPGLLPGQYLTIDVSGLAAWNLPAFLNGNWLIQQVEATCVPALEQFWGGNAPLWGQEAMPWEEDAQAWNAGGATYTYGPMLYTITLISVSTIANWISDFERLAQKKP